MNVCQENVGEEGGQSPCACVLLSILICRAATGGRLVLVAVCVCVIRRCSCLFLITSLRAKLPAFSAGVLVENERDMSSLQCMFVCAFESGG